MNDATAEVATARAALRRLHDDSTHAAPARPHPALTAGRFDDEPATERTAGARAATATGWNHHGAATPVRTRPDSTTAARRHRDGPAKARSARQRAATARARIAVGVRVRYVFATARWQQSSRGYDARGQRQK